MTTLLPPPGNTERQQLLDAALLVCSSEAIHLIGSIQPAGVLLAVDRRLFTLQAGSANLDKLFALDTRAALGQPLAALIGQPQAHWLAELLERGDWVGAKIWSLELPGPHGTVRRDAQLILSGDLLLIEVELTQSPPGDVFQELFVPIRDSLWKLDAENDMNRYAEMAVEQVRLLTGFDRVMMYRFDSNWDGEVIAESRAAGVDSYLGNRFPASDIPPQARALYTRNLVRLIADVDSEAVPLLAWQDDDAPVDLSHSWLRRLSPVHLEYLRNMGVRASLSISLVQNNRLWGLIACHHFSPRYVSLRERELDEFIGRVVSLKLINMDALERDVLGRRIHELLTSLTQRIRASSELDEVILSLQDQLLGLVRSDGAVVVIDGVQHSLGEVPPHAVVDALVRVLRERPIAPVYCTDDLQELGLEGGVLAAGLQEGARGLMVAPLDHRMHDFVMWFRPGMLRTLKWAGNPEKKLVADANGVHLSPRSSFGTWIQTYHGKCLPWSRVEVDAANSLSMALIEVLAQKALKSSEESYRLLAENSTDMIARLDLQGVFQFASPACRELFARESSQLSGAHLADVLQEPAQDVADLLKTLQTLGSTVTRSLRGRRPDGAQLWIEATLKHALGANGQPELLLNARDITQRYIYQMAIEDVHRRNTQILEASNEALISLDTRGCIVYVNDHAAKLLQQDEAALLGSCICDSFCGKRCERCLATQEPCAFFTTIADGETRQGTRRLGLNGDAYAVHVQYVCTPLVENRQVAGCVVVFSELQARLDAGQFVPTDVILDAALEAVLVTDAHKCITSVNRSFTEITGFSAQEAIGKDPSLLKSGVHTPHFYAALWQMLNAKRRWSGEIWNRRKNGEIYPQWGSISAILGPDGAVQNYVAVFSDISKAKQAEEKLFHLATHDSLTNLPNRMNFTESLGLMLERCKRHGRALAVLFIDLDRFKIINDTLGHAVGDLYLKTIADRLSAASRRPDPLARWGGDEFILAMEDVGNRQHISEAVTRMQTALAEPIHLAGHELIPTASIGIALYPADAVWPAALIKAADTAMYGTKERGGNGFLFYTDDMAKDLGTKLTLSSELRHAFAERQFELLYQPQVDPQTGLVKGVEALARWNHPLRGQLAPVHFLGTVEEMGLIGDLGEWALRQACRQMKIWSRDGTPVPKVSVNVAPSQLTAAFVALVAQVLAESGIAPQQLELEITEGALKSGDLAQRITDGLRALGVLLAVDDFGTGYSSLAHIKLFPITCFKIDKSFIDGVPDNASDVAIVQTILALGSSFKVEIVAEGVETLAQVEFLLAQGVNNIQGYYFGRPMSPTQLLEWFHTAVPH